MAWDVSSWFINEAGTKAPNIVRKLHAAYLRDASDNQFDAIGFGSPVFVAGTIATQALRTDGIDDYFAITGKTYSTSSLTHPVTVEAYLAVNSGDASNDALGMIMCFGNIADFFRYGITVNSIAGAEVNSPLLPGHAFFLIQANSTTRTLDGGETVTDGSMHHVAARFDPSTENGQLKFFVDGRSSQIVTDVGTVWGIDKTSFGAVGIQMADNPSVFNAVSDERRIKADIEYIRLWDVARTDAEINSYHDTVSLDTTSGLQINYDMQGMGDISNRVTQWPSFRRHWSDIRPQSARLSLANDDGYFNDLWLKPQAGLTTFAMEFGFTHPTSGDELITPFVGRLGTAHHQRGRLSLTIDDKVSQLSEVIIGTNDSPITYTDSTLPSEMVWDWLTNIGPYSSVESTSNPDINYASFQDWAGVFSSDNIVINGNFSGQKITEALRKMARYTQSAIYMEGGKINFSRFTAVNTSTTFITGDNTLDSSVSVQMGRVVTKQIVLAGYNVNSDSWAIEATHIDSDASVSYGLRENIERDENIWYTTSVSAVNLAQRYTLIGGNPYEDINATTTLKPLPRQVGETINFTNDQADISKGYRIMEMEFDMNSGIFNMLINASQTETPFILDQSELDSTDKLL